MAFIKEPSLVPLVRPPIPPLEAVEEAIPTDRPHGMDHRVRYWFLGRSGKRRTWDVSFNDREVFTDFGLSFGTNPMSCTSTGRTRESMCLRCSDMLACVRLSNTVKITACSLIHSSTLSIIHTLNHLFSHLFRRNLKQKSVNPRHSSAVRHT